MKTNFLKIEPFIIGLSIGINFLLMFAFLLNTSDYWFNYLFNGDLLFITNIYQDIFENGYGLNGWHFPGGQFFFPDMILYFMIKAFVGNVGLTYIVFITIQILVIDILIYLLFKRLFSNSIKAYYITGISVILFSLIPLIYLNTGEFLFPFYLFTVNFHIGAFINALIFLNILIRTNKTSPISSWLFLGLSTLLGVGSDKLFVLMALIPSILALVILIKPYGWKWVAKTLVSITIGYALASLGMRLLEIYVIDFMKVKPTITMESITYSFSVLIPQTIGYIKKYNLLSLVVLSLPVSIILSAVLSYQKHRQKDYQTAFFTLTVLLFLTVVFLLPAFTGIYKYTTHLRYNVTAYHFSLLMLPALFWLLFNFKARILPYIYIGLAVIFIYLGLSSLRDTQHTIADYKNYYPEYIAKLDSLNSVLPLKRGLSTYWNSTQIRAISKAKLPVYNVHTRNLTSDHFISNKKWYIKETEMYPEAIFNYFYLSYDINDSIFYQHFDTIYITEKIDNMYFYYVPDFVYENRKIKVLDAHVEIN